MTVDDDAPVSACRDADHIRALARSGGPISNPGYPPPTPASSLMLKQPKHGSVVFLPARQSASHPCLPSLPASQQFYHSRALSDCDALLYALLPTPQEATSAAALARTALAARYGAPGSGIGVRMAELLQDSHAMLSAEQVDGAEGRGAVAGNGTG